MYEGVPARVELPLLPDSVAAGLEEEFHIVHLRTRRLTAQADSLVEQLPAGRFGSEFQRSVLEANSLWVPEIVSPTPDLGFPQRQDACHFSRRQHPRPTTRPAWRPASTSIPGRMSLLRRPRRRSTGPLT